MSEEVNEFLLVFEANMSKKTVIQDHYYLVCTLCRISYDFVVIFQHTDIKLEENIHIYNSFFLTIVVGVAKFL